MKTSDKTDALIAALLKARASFPVIHKDKVAKVPTKSGGSYSYNYADLSSVIDGTKEALLGNGLLLQHGMESNGHTILTCRLSHVTGQWQESQYPIPAGIDAQQMGSAITYGRRYTACAMLGICTEDDDDGEGAKPAQTQKKTYILPSQPKAVPPAKPAEEDRVPASVTDAQSPHVVQIEDAPVPVVTPDLDGMEVCQVKGFNPKPKPTKNGGNQYGIVLVTAAGEAWFNTFSNTVFETAKLLKGKEAFAKFEKNGQYTNLTELVEVKQ